ncbi:MFS transporter, partial [Asanoa sp. NPDC050611]|uniref:MFS transporter n=1 Tax=Asanoa sp. NPDC050611 TaxID=3157098 RepID=UPI0033DB22AA
VAAAALLLVARAPMPGPAAPGHDPLPAAVRGGIALLWRIPPLRAATAATTVGYAAQGLLPVGFPLLAIHFGHPAAHGAWFLTAMSAGSLVGAVASARLLRRFAPIPVLAASLALLGTALATVGMAPNLPVALAVATVGGVATGPMLAATLAVRQQSVPARRYGQVVATAASIKVGAFALGASATGLVTGWLPPRGVLVLVGAAQLVALLPLATAGPARVEVAAGLSR